MKQQFEYLCHERATSQNIIDDIDGNRARHFERIGYGRRNDITGKVRAREMSRIEGIDAFLKAAGYQQSTIGPWQKPQ